MTTLSEIRQTNQEGVLREKNHRAHEYDWDCCEYFSGNF